MDDLRLEILYEALNKLAEDKAKSDANNYIKETELNFLIRELENKIKTLEAQIGDLELQLIKLGKDSYESKNKPTV